MKPIESISNSNCENEQFSLVETKPDISDTFDDYLTSAQPSVKLPSVSDSPVSLFIKKVNYIIKTYICKTRNNFLANQNLYFSLNIG